MDYNDEYPPKARLEKMLERQLRYFTDLKGGGIFGNTILETANSEPSFKPFVQSTIDKWAKAFVYVLQTKYPMDEAEELAYGIVQDFKGGMMLYQLQGVIKYLEAARKRAAVLL